MNWIADFWTGRLSLAKVFWLYGVVGIGATQLAVGYIISSFLQPSFSSMALLFFAALAYQVFVYVGVWRSAGSYEGHKALAIFAKVVVVLSCGAMLAGFAFGGFVVYKLFNSNDSSRNSATVSQTLDRNPAYPFTGFWKDDCSHNYGLVIEPTIEPATYTIAFCGPGGCVAKGAVNSSSTIVGDPLYQVIDKDTVEMFGSKQTMRYVRCE